MEKNKITIVVNKIFQKYDVDISRSGKWGNPFVIGKDGTREEVIKKYEEYIRNKPELLNRLNELKNKRLGCYCSPRYKCHGDVLVKLLKEKCELDNAD